jgi:TonB family protein
MRALLLSALLTSLLVSEASAQRRIRVLGTLAADSVTFRVGAGDDGEAGVLATHGTSNMWCGADPRTIRDWVRGSRMMLDSAVAIGGRGAHELRGPSLSGACGIRLTRTAEGVEIDFGEPGEPTRVSARTSSADAKRLLGWLDAAANAGDVAAQQQLAAPAPAVAPRGAAYFEFQVEKPASPLPSSAQPTYPPALRSANLAGEVLAQFVVDTSGFVELDTFKVLKSTHALFTEAVRQALSQFRYSPAEVGGRKVRQLVQTPFVFTAK